MKNYKHGCLLLIVVTCAACTYGQAWKQYTDSAKVFEQQKKTERALEMYGKAKEALRKDSLNTETYAACCNSLAVLCYYAGLLEKAEPLYLEAKQVREKVLGKAHPAYAASCSGLGALYRYMGKYDKAEPLFQEAKRIRETVLGKQHPDYASSCNSLAVLYQNTGQYEKAVPLCLEAKQILEKAVGTAHPDYARTCANLAVLYQSMGQYEKAETLYLEAKQIQEKVVGKEHVAYASVCSHLALLYVDIGQYEKAEPLLLEVKLIRETELGKQHPDYAIACSNLSIVYQNTERYEKAEPLLLEAIQIEEKVFGKDHPDYAISCNNLAMLYEQMERFESAATFYAKAGQIAEKVLGKEHPDYITYCNNLGILYMNTGQYRKAEPLLAEAKRLGAKVLGKQHQNYGSYCRNLANVYWLLKEPLRAEKEFEEAFAVNAYNISSVFRFTGEKEKTAYIRNVAGENEETYSFFLHERIPSAQPYSLSLFYRNLVLSSSEALKKQLFASGDTSLVRKYEAWVSVRKHLAALYSGPAEDRADAAAIEEEAGLQEKELTRLSAAFAKQQRKPDWKAIKSRLKEKEAAVEFASFHVNSGSRHTDTVCYVALVLRKNMPLPVMVFLFNEPQLTDLLSSAGNRSVSGSIQKLYAFSGDGPAGEKSAVTSLYGLIWKPMEKALQGVSTVYFAPSGILHRVAFAALPVNKKEVLSDRYRLVQLATTAALADQRQTYLAASDKLQLYGGISYNADTAALKDVALAYHSQSVVSRSLPDDLVRGGEAWTELPATQKEIAGIVSSSGKYQANIVSFSGLDATEESLKALDGKASPAVLHIATHGFFFPDPKQYNPLQKEEKGRVFKLSDDPLMRAGLLFAGANNAWRNKPAADIDDGILTAYEVANLYLPHTKLVVLSACETGLGEIRGSEGVYGLQRAFKMAGAQNLVMSLWKVSDQETAEFMTAFYKRLFARQTISDAFYAAQAAMKARYRLQPYKWAAWVLVR